MTAEATALAKATQQVRDAARAHKRSSSFHRKQARALMETFDELKAVCDAHGIKLEIEAKGNFHGPQ